MFKLEFQPSKQDFPKQHYLPFQYNVNKQLCFIQEQYTKIYADGGVHTATKGFTLVFIQYLLGVIRLLFSLN